MKHRSLLHSFVAILLMQSLLLAESSFFGDNGFGSETEESARTYEERRVESQPTLLSLKRQIQRQNERIDGLTTLVEGMSASLFELQQKMNAPVRSSEEKELLKELAEKIDKIDKTYVSKSELKEILENLGKLKSASPKPTPKQSSEEKFKGKSNAAIYSEGVRLFGKRRYDDSRERFRYTEKKGYKPAASNYYLGEISYYTKAYDNAVFYYKKSAGLYDKASYIDVLLLHTGISLEKSGKKEQAKIFFQNVIENYADRKSAKIAKEHLKKL
jgi:TolA-binding protein